MVGLNCVYTKMCRSALEPLSKTTRHKLLCSVDRRSWGLGSSISQIRGLVHCTKHSFTIMFSTFKTIIDNFKSVWMKERESLQRKCFDRGFGEVVKRVVDRYWETFLLGLHPDLYCLHSRLLLRIYTHFVSSFSVLPTILDSRFIADVYCHN